MQATATFQVYGVNAYRSELALYRAQGVTADEAEQVVAPVDARELYKVDRSDSPLVITHDARAAFSAFEEGALARDRDVRLMSIKVIG